MGYLDVSSLNILSLQISNPNLIISKLKFQRATTAIEICRQAASIDVRSGPSGNLTEILHEQNLPKLFGCVSFIFAILTRRISDWRKVTEGPTNSITRGCTIELVTVKVLLSNWPLFLFLWSYDSYHFPNKTVVVVVRS